MSELEQARLFAAGMAGFESDRNTARLRSTTDVDRRDARTEPLTAALCLLADRVSETSYRFALPAIDVRMVALAAAAARLRHHRGGRRRCVLVRPGGAELRRDRIARRAADGGVRRDLFYVLHLEKRTELVEIKPSRAILLVDTSQSMGLQDTGQSSAGSGPGLSRIDRVVSELRRGDMLRQLRTPRGGRLPV